MGSVSWRKVAGYAGIAYVVIFFALGLTIFDGPVITDSAADMRQWFGDNTTTIALFTWAAPLAFGILFMVFASGLRSALGPADADNDGMWARISFAGAVIQAAVGFVGLSFWAVLAQEDILAVISDDTMVALNALDQIIFFAIMNWASAIFLVGASVVIIQSGVMPKWIGWLGAFLALTGVVAALWPFTGDSGGFFDIPGTISFLGFLVWAVAVSVTMIRSTSEESTPVGAHS